MEIVDPRTVADFQKTTFCGHTRARVIKVLHETIQKGHADYACYWSLELLCSGLVHSLWMAFFDAAAQHINRAHPNVFLYLEKAYERYAPLEHKYPVVQMTQIRNNPDVRRMVCETAATMAMCRKNKLPSLPTIKPAHDFDPLTIQETLKAPSQMYGRLVLRREDPMPVVAPLNEFVYALRPDVRDATKALYWMSWVYAYCREHKKQTKQALVFADRTDEYVEAAHGRHVVWMFWEAVRKQALPQTRPYVDALRRMYSIRWSPSDAKARQSLLTAAILLVCEGVTLDTTPVTSETLAVAKVLEGIPGWLNAIQQTSQSFST
jgi:hypothetical protein